MSKTTTRLLAVSALAFAAGFFATTQLQAGQVLPGDIIIAQGAGGSGGSGGSSGRDFNEDSQSGNPSGRSAPPSAANPGSTNQRATPSNPNPVLPNNTQSGVPARCASIADPVARQACINQ